MIFGFTSHVKANYYVQCKWTSIALPLPFFVINFVLLTVYLWHEANSFAFMCRILLNSTKWLSLRAATLSFT